MTRLRTLDELAVALSDLRAASGSPSYAEIARRIGVGTGAEPAKVTVYDCFRSGRRRLDPDLIREIVLALGEGDEAAERWREAAARLSGERSGAHVQVTIAHRGARSHRTGREGLLEELPEADVLVLSGLPGVGKSTLASAIADGRETVTVELRESETERPPAGPIDVIRRILGARGLRSVPYDLARLRERLAAELDGALIVLEDAVSTETLAALIVPGVRYIVTSRVDLAAVERSPALHGLRVRRIPVRALDDSGALRLLVQFLAEEPIDARASTRPDADALARIVAVSGGLPLDIAMLAGVVREHSGWTFDDLASRFENESRDARIRPVLEAATRALPNSDADLLADAALLERTIDIDILRAVHPHADEIVARLRSRHLVDVIDGSIQMHATVFDFVHDRAIALRPESQRRRSVQRFATALLARIDDDPDAAARGIVTVLAIAEAARAHGLDAVCESIAVRTMPVLTRWTLWSESLRLHDLAARGRDLTEIPELALGIAHSAEKLGRFDEALVILHRVRRIATGSALARTWNQIGNVQRWMSRFDEALPAYTTAMEIARNEHDAVVEGRALGNHADTLRILARYETAESEYAAALEIATRADDSINIDIIRGNRCLLWTATGRFDAADAELRTLLAQAGDRAVPHVRMTLALLSEARGDDAGAEAIADEMSRIGAGEYGSSADMVLLRARLDARAGRVAEAADAARAALDQAQRSGSPVVATEAANTLAEIAFATGDLDSASHSAGEAIGIAEVTGDLAEVARGWGTLARIALAQGDGSAAAELASDAVRLYREIGHRLGASAADRAHPR